MVRMPFWQFFWATMLGQIPAGMAYSYLVQQVDQPKLFAVDAGCFIVALTLLGLVMRRVFKDTPDNAASKQTDQNKRTS